MTDYIYAIIDDRDRVYYVGRTQNPRQRFYGHQSKKPSWFASIPNPKMIILETVEQASDPSLREQFWFFEMKKRGEPINNVNIPARPSIGTKPDTSIYLGPERRAWLKAHGGIQPTIHKMIDAAM